jgi:hypothetical protein
MATLENDEKATFTLDSTSERGMITARKQTPTHKETHMHRLIILTNDNPGTIGKEVEYFSGTTTLGRARYAANRRCAEFRDDGYNVEPMYFVSGGVEEWHAHHPDGRSAIVTIVEFTDTRIRPEIKVQTIIRHRSQPEYKVIITRQWLNKRVDHEYCGFRHWMRIKSHMTRQQYYKAVSTETYAVEY